MKADIIIRRLAAALEHREKRRKKWQAWRQGDPVVFDPQDIPEDLFDLIEEYLFNRYKSIDDVIKEVESGDLGKLGREQAG
jgi:hypothetical protein